MREYKSLAEWLESKGNPKHHIANGENGSKVIVIDELNDSLSPGLTIYSFTDEGHFWMSSGWGIRKEYLPALKGFLNEDNTEKPMPDADEFIQFKVIEWRDDEGDDGEGEYVIDRIYGLTEAHARIILRNGIYSDKYPKGAWLEYTLDGKRICLDLNGRIPA